MTPEPSTDGFSPEPLSSPLDCYGTPVRVLMRDGCPWFEALPLCAAMAVDWPAFVRFAATALDTDIRQVPFDTEPLPALSPIGHYEFVSSLHAPELAKFAAWSRRKAAELVPNPNPDDRRLCLTLNPDGTRPDEPNRYTGRHYEWKELKFRPGYKPVSRYASAPSSSGPSRSTSSESLDDFIARIALGHNIVRSQSEYTALASGSEYIAPDGSKRIKR